jgi:hypothetical protein
MKKTLVLGALMFMFSLSITNSVDAFGKENKPNTKDQGAVSVEVKVADITEEDKGEDSISNRNQEREENKVKGTKRNNDTEEASMGEQRRSQVANAVHEMLQVADRVGGIGEQVRVVAQSQQQNHEEVEDKLDEIKERSGLAKFFIGPKYDKIEKAKELIKQDKEKINKLEEIKSTLVSEEDKTKVDEQISIIKGAITEVEKIVGEEQSGFSLFGWLAKIF